MRSARLDGRRPAHLARLGERCALVGPVARVDRGDLGDDHAAAALRTAAVVGRVALRERAAVPEVGDVRARTGRGCATCGARGRPARAAAASRPGGRRREPVGRPDRGRSRTARRRAVPCPFTQSGSGPSSGSPVKNFAAMHPPLQASHDPHDAHAPPLPGARSSRNAARRATRVRTRRRGPSRRGTARGSRTGRRRRRRSGRQAHDAARPAQVEPVERGAERREVEERVARERVGVVDEPRVEPRFCSAVGRRRSQLSTPRPDGRSLVSRSWAPNRCASARSSSSWARCPS